MDRQPLRVTGIWALLITPKGEPKLLLGLLTMLAMLALAPYGFIRHHLFNYRLRSAAESRPCPSCGHPLGASALRAADTFWRGRSDVHHDDRTLMVILRRIYAFCPGCDTLLDFQEESGVFVPAEVPA